MLNLQSGKAGIYCFIHKQNGKVYVGQARCIAKRYRDHARLDANTLFGRALRKHSIAAFSFYILELVEDLSLLDSREQFHLDAFQAYDPERGYNTCLMASSCLGVKRTPETRKRISASKIGRVRTKRESEVLVKMSIGNTGKKHTPEARAKMSAKLLGHSMSEETRKKISDTLKNKGGGEAHPNFGRKFSEEHRAKISASRKGKTFGKRIKKASL